jgi:hypothetical protein
MDKKTAQQAAQLFEEGKSVSAIAKALKISWYEAKKLKPASAKAEDPAKTIAPHLAYEIGPEPGPESEAEALAETTLVFPINLEIPVEQVDEAIAAVSDMELRDAVIGLDGADKANILQIVLQARLTSLLNHSGGGDPELIPEL